jgi:tetratricopeptide (TPR) repeat protein
MRIRLLSTLLLALFSSMFVVAQRTPPPGRGIPGAGNNTSIPVLTEDTEIQVRLAWPSGQPVNDVIHIQLINSSGIPIANTFSRDGMAEFRSQKFGTYQLKLDSPTIADALTDRFQIVPGEGMHMEWVHLTPKDPNAAAGGKPQGQISAAEMNVPDKARKEMEKGMELLDKNDYKEADKHFQKAVDLYPKFARAWNNIGVVRAKTGDRPGAVEAWQKAIGVDERYGSAYFNLSRVSIANKQPAEAQKLIEKGLTANPNDVEGLFLLATSQAMQGNWDQALINARKVHAGEHKRFPDVHMIAAQGLAAQNQPKLAIEEYELYLKEYPDSPNAALVRQNMAQLQSKIQ